METALGLVRELGVRAFDAGPLRNAVALESLMPVLRCTSASATRKSTSALERAKAVKDLWDAGKGIGGLLGQ
jgi:predicted dinucleotide-binding enzyme